MKHATGLAMLYSTAVRWYAEMPYGMQEKVWMDGNAMWKSSENNNNYDNEYNNSTISSYM